MKRNVKKENDSFSGDRIAIRRRSERLRTFNQTIYLFNIAMLAGMLEDKSGVDVSVRLPDQLKIAEYVPPIEPDVFDDLTVIRIDNPQDDFETGTAANEETVEQFRIATDVLADASGGTLYPASSINSYKVVVEPEGRIYHKDGAVGSCYTVDQLKETKKQVLESNEIPDDVMTAISFESYSGIVCGNERALGFNWTGGDDIAKAGVYQYNSLRIGPKNKPVEQGADTRSTLVLHEVGHELELDHVGRMTIADDAFLPEDHLTNVQTYIDAGLTYVRKESEHAKTSEIDPYASRKTVMGGMHHYNEGNIPFSFVERQKLNPTIESIKTIEIGDNVDVQVGIDGPVQGIRLALPEDHPLRQIEGEAPIESVEYGMDFLYGHGDYTTISNYVTNSEGEVFEGVFGAWSPNITTDTEPIDQQELYRDETLGLTIAVTYDGSDYRRATLNVRPIIEPSIFTPQ